MVGWDALRRLFRLLPLKGLLHLLRILELVHLFDAVSQYLVFTFCLFAFSDDSGADGLQR